MAAKKTRRAGIGRMSRAKKVRLRERAAGRCRLPRGAEGEEARRARRVDVRLYRLIYEAIDDAGGDRGHARAAAAQRSSAGPRSELFTITGAGRSPGSPCATEDDPRRPRPARARSRRRRRGRITSLRRFKEDVREVAAGYECGIRLEGCTDVRVGDVVEAVEIDGSRAG
jgi:translation initiation factor IF-2